MSGEPAIREEAEFAEPVREAAASPEPEKERLAEGPLPVERRVKESPPEEEAPKESPAERAKEGEESMVDNEKPAEAVKPASNPESPGFRGNQSKTRLEGSISRTGRSALNVEDSALGRYHATVSRAVANKYMQTPQGLFEMKYFFTPRFETAGGALSNTSVKDHISQLVGREDANKPLSDQEIVAILKEQGIPIARRTVAKYRNELNILPYNRAIKDLNCQDRNEFLAKVATIFSLEVTNQKEPTQAGECCMYLKDQWYRLTWQAAAEASPIDQLDVSILQDRLLAPVLGIDDPRTSKRVDFIGGIRGTAELEKLVDSREFAVAFSLYPVTVEQLIAISDAAQIMPPKITWFEPKLRSGFFIHTLD
jgi:hypothetical protein